MSDSIANIDILGNRFISNEYDCLFDETTYILNVKGVGWETNMSFAEDVAEQTALNYYYTDFAIGYKDENDKRYVYLAFMSSETSNEAKIIIYECDFEHNTKTVKTTYTQTVAYYGNTYDWLCIKPSLYTLDFLLKVSVSTPAGPNNYYFSGISIALWNGTSFVTQLLSNMNYTDTTSLDEVHEVPSYSHFYSRRCFKGPNSNLYLITDNFGVPNFNSIKYDGKTVNFLTVNSTTTKGLFYRDDNLYLFDVDFNASRYDQYFINGVPVEKPSSIGSPLGYNYSNGSNIGLIFSKTITSNEAYEWRYAVIDTNDNICYVKHGYDEKLSNPTIDDYRSGNIVIDSRAEKVYSVSMEPVNVETGVEFNDTNWYRVDELGNSAVASNLLKNKYAATDTGIIKGTMTDNGSLNYTPTTSAQTIPEGYTSGGTISAVTNAIDSNIKSSNIKSGVTILGVSGSSTVVDTSDANATADNIMNGRTAYVNGEKIVGTIKGGNRVFVNIKAGTEVTPSTCSLGNDLIINGYTIPSSLIPNINDYNFLVVYNYASATGDWILLFVCPKGAELRYNYSYRNNTKYIKSYYENTTTTASLYIYCANNNWTPGSIDTTNKKVNFWYTLSNPAGGISISTYVTNQDIYYVNSSGVIDETNKIFYKNYTASDKDTLYITDNIPDRILLSDNTEYNTSIKYSDVATAISLTSDKIKEGETVLGVTGTYGGQALTFATVEEMEAYENPTEDLYAIVYGTTYVGTYRYDGSNWTQIGDSTQEQETMDVLNDVMGTTDQYEGTGGTDVQINEVFDDILGN